MLFRYVLPKDCLLSTALFLNRNHPVLEFYNSLWGLGIGIWLSYRPARLHKLVESIPGLLKSLKYRLRSQGSLCVGAKAAFWRTFHHDGKMSPGWWRWGAHAHPLSLYLSSHTKLQCTLQLSGQIHSPYFYSTPMCTCGSSNLPHPSTACSLRFNGWTTTYPFVLFLHYSTSGRFLH